MPCYIIIRVCGIDVTALFCILKEFMMFVVPGIVALIAGVYMWIETDGGWVGVITGVVVFVLLAALFG